MSTTTMTTFTTEPATRDLGEWRDIRQCALCRGVGDCARAARLLSLDGGVRHSRRWCHHSRIYARVSYPRKTHLARWLVM
jgi:hypothetical protein